MLLDQKFITFMIVENFQFIFNINFLILKNSFTSKNTLNQFSVSFVLFQRSDVYQIYSKQSPKSEKYAQPLTVTYQFTSFARTFFNFDIHIGTLSKC